MKLQAAGLIVAFLAQCTAKTVHTYVRDDFSTRSRSVRGLNGEEEGRYVSRRTRERADVSSIVTEERDRTHVTGHPDEEMPLPKKDERKKEKMAPDVGVTTTGTSNRESGPVVTGRGGRDPDPSKTVADKSPKMLYSTVTNTGTTISSLPNVAVSSNVAVTSQSTNLAQVLTCQIQQCMGQPSEMKFYFTGDSCRNSQNYMGGYFMPYYDSMLTTTSYLYVTDAQNGGNVFYSGRVSPGQTVSIDNDTMLPAELMVTVYDMQVTQILQMFRIRSDCQAALAIGDTFCGVMVREITNPSQGTYGTCAPTGYYYTYSMTGRGRSSAKSSKGSGVLVSQPGTVYGRGKTSKNGYSAVVPTTPAATPSQQCYAPATMLRLQLTGGGCRASKPFNDQGKEFMCLLDNSDSMQSVTVNMIGPATNEVVLNQVLNMNDVIELRYPPTGTLPTTMTAQILSADSSTSIQVFQFNPSCAAPISIGDRLGAFTVVGFQNNEQGLVTSTGAVPTMPTVGMPSSPSMTPNSAPTYTQCRGSLCTDSPRRLIFTFEGNMCSQNSHSQGSGFACLIDSAITYPAKVLITSSTDPSIIGYSGTVTAKGQEIIVGDGSFVLPASMSMVVMDNNEQIILQSVTFMTDCQTNLYNGDYYGALHLVEFTHSGGTFGGCRGVI